MSDKRLPRRIIDWLKSHTAKLARPMWRRSFVPDLWLTVTLLSAINASYRLGIVFATGQLSAGQFLMLLFYVASGSVGLVIVWAHLSGAPRTIVKNNTFNGIGSGGAGLVLNNSHRGGR